MIQNPTYLPGEFIINYDLSRIGNGVYVDDNRLLASIKGKIVKEDGRMEIKDNLPEIRIGAIIVGKVMKIKEDKAFVSIIKVNC